MSSKRGFTVIEIMIVVTIIGLLATLAVPHFRKIRRRARNAVFINNLRILSDSVFEQYAIENGGYPADAPPGVIPAGIQPYMARRVHWEEGTPIGGQWNWDRGATRTDKINGVYASIEAVGVSRTADQMRELDGEFDDGNLLTGMFRQTPTGYMQIMEH
ncbi:MAG: type II secretion system protein [Kiritimatiellia bacterium]|nr:type II secretion system protein [Kiritimatiellia bacterium]MDP6810014.1 type II secretion system protein [Kiritimatiellia bacterium]MDP7024785.1 type II secretion system protein [Kiritimatiellia bacterium]